MVNVVVNQENESVEAETNIARTIFLATTIENIQNQAGETRSERPYLEKHNLPTPPLTPGRKSGHRTKGWRSLLEIVVISIDTMAKNKTTTTSETNLLRILILLKNSTHRTGSPPLRRQPDWTEEGAPMVGGDGLQHLGFLEGEGGYFTGWIIHLGQIIRV